MKIKIYSINDDRDEKRLCYCGLNETERILGTKTIDASIYDCVYSGDVDCQSLEEVFQMFNDDNRPDDYGGRSMSVSDVVEVIESDIVKEDCYFCDNFGFSPVKFDVAEASTLESKKIRVLMVEPGRKAYAAEIGTELEDFYHALDCDTIEAMYPVSDLIVIVCDEEGKLNGSVPNRAVYDDDGTMIDIICGKFFVCDCSGDSFGSLPDDMLEKYKKEFLLPERFIRINNNICPIKYDPERTDVR